MTTDLIEGAEPITAATAVGSDAPALATRALRSGTAQRRRIVAIGAGVAVLIAAAIAVPVAVTAVAHQNAVDAYRAALASQRIAEKQLTAAAEQLAGVQKTTLVADTSAAALITATDVTMIDPATALDTLKTAQQRYHALVTAPAVQEPGPVTPIPSGKTGSSSVDQLTAATKTVTTQAMLIGSESAALVQQRKNISASGTKLSAASMALLAAAAKSATAWARPAQSSDASWTSYQTAVTALTTKTSSTAGDPMTGYVAARNAVQTSSDHAIAAAATAAAKAKSTAKTSTTKSSTSTSTSSGSNVAVP